MRFNKLVTSISLTIGTVLFVSNSAQAASFTSNVTLEKENAAKGDVILNSITQEDKNGDLQTFSNFSFVKKVRVWENDKWTKGNEGAASTDAGDLTQFTLKGKTKEDPTAGQMAKFLKTNNLNNIIDTEDGGTFKMGIFFDSLIQEDDKGLDNLFFFERGMNSNMLIQALDSDGKTIGNQLFLKGKDKEISNALATEIDGITRKEDQEYAGYQIDTNEIGGSQKVGSWGVSLKDLGVDSLSGVQIYASGSSYQGPDFKVIARQSSSGPKFAQAAKVPEPGTIIGLSSVAALAFFRRRKSK